MFGNATILWYLCFLFVSYWLQHCTFPPTLDTFFYYCCEGNLKPYRADSLPSTRLYLLSIRRDVAKLSRWNLSLILHILSTAQLIRKCRQGKSVKKAESFRTCSGRKRGDVVNENIYSYSSPSFANKPNLNVGKLWFAGTHALSLYTSFNLSFICIFSPTNLLDRCTRA